MSGALAPENLKFWWSKVCYSDSIVRESERMDDRVAGLLDGEWLNFQFTVNTLRMTVLIITM